MERDTKTLTIDRIREAFRRGELSSTELVQAYLATIEKENASLNAYLEVFDDVLYEAGEADKKIKSGGDGKLLGVPIAVKDNILIKGKRAGAASKILEGYRASYDATAIARLKAEGAIFIGRTNMDEFAMGGSNENSAYGPVRNPHDHARVSGGSSGGSAAAVAMGSATAAIGSDTGGSVRQPASYCGVVGLKPTYGAVSRYGLIAMGSSLDQIGLLTRSVKDAEILFDVIRGSDALDNTTSLRAASDGRVPMTIGIPGDLVSETGLDPIVFKNFNESVKKLEELGYKTKDIKLPHAKFALAMYYIIMPAEASSNLARFDGVKYGLHKDGGNGLLSDYLETRSAGFGKEVKRRILIGNYILSAGYYDAYYNKANMAREMLRKDFRTAFQEVDLILTPTAPTPAFVIGEKDNDPLSMYLEDIFTVTANLAGVPALSVPFGTKEVGGKKLPLGIQFAAPWNREEHLFEVGKRFNNE
ncbi:MAG: glutaminyl-tRNA synthase (glutamine-hydrolyzing) subunit A [Candidatus Taylorbacteria bacterium RIFCSPLOWO2_01_FULL_45_15b]|uniref:Glutamyl-tRNA(Gln) amidotransferase subunit A n=1 Tax=Candidatus Taylorbacteria bacterium RIFCSPLOWO2_01_FULL_45_15b TaxID=1802319 RepID=A0A1G2NEZ7_9BACT|nr:MAG: glutaminyl-tRNA synthase (glutamine-hydrolyzing) subunit A [Candidatus Taylorbacteria bacterium RIFCSPLOWO2_01_FULL_45_15b]